MKIERIRETVDATERRVTAEVQPPTGPGAPTAIELLKARADATAPGQFETEARRQARTLQLQEGGRKISRSELERTLGRDDLVDVNYLARGLQAARAVARLAIRDATGRSLGDGTGFLIAPGLLLTNHHVFPTAADAAASLALFDCELDLMGFERPTTTFALEPARFFVADAGLDFALVAVGADPLNGPGRLDDYGWLRLSPDLGKINEGEPITVIQHPNGRAKQIALRENRLLSISADHLTYESDTAPGSSGAPVFNDSWQVVALHHSGVPRKDAQGRWLLKNGTPVGDDDDDADVDWIANEGVRASRVASTVLGLAPDGPLGSGLEAACLGQIRPASGTAAGTRRPTEQHVAPGPVASPAPAPTAVASTTFGEVTIPLTVTVRLGMAAAPGAPALAEAPERNVEPWHDPDYVGRKGYRPDFLGIAVSLPDLTDAADATPRTDGQGVLVPYEHFTLAMHRLRRLPIFTAANVDFSPAAKEPEPGFVYTRRALGGLGEKDREKWFLDPRLPASSQLPERFFNNDRQAFDKGHLVRREEVCWGVDHAQVRRANGDTYHVTNCTPQVAGFNQSKFDGLWGELENEIEDQGATERYCLFAGPLLVDDDPVFLGVDDAGPVSVRIPRAYWKVIVARDGDDLAAFGFLLEQDLTKVAFEFDPEARWRRHMLPLKTLQARIGLVRFPKAVLKADRFAAV
ncbi:hypothetical protein BZG35_02915 [Brevundimonas sp. LM2]|uniref:DNA/RNA non-specific endonuclease n=1 Tax=Brevundimonas sp. LM2 TaxID=1938605 RepID=UPI000983A74A|nr:DNA/RNA non-specific endonuclease [Brevundimonas sp. LM2]AQR60719.1 hypothetical protein BZG35_02915 [Brevundimonas sp. LM2]